MCHVFSLFLGRKLHSLQQSNMQVTLLLVASATLMPLFSSNSGQIYVVLTHVDFRSDGGYFISWGMHHDRQF